VSSDVIIPEHSRPPRFGDDHEEATYQSQRREALLRQRVRFAVAPRCCVVSTTRGMLEGGAEVTAGDVASGQPALRALVQLGVLLDLSPGELAPADPPGATHRVARGISVPTRRGLVPDGGAVAAADFAEEAVPTRAEVAPVMRLDGSVVPGSAAIPGRPAHDGRAALEDLVRRGALVPINTKGRAA
jgi:hypothetical protein